MYWMMESHFVDIPIWNKQETYKQIIGMSRNNDHRTGNSPDYEYFSKHYKLVAIDLSKQIELENLDLKYKINFFWNLGENNGTMFYIIEKKEETTFDFSQNFFTVLLWLPTLWKWKLKRL